MPIESFGDLLGTVVYGPMKWSKHKKWKEDQKTKQQFVDLLSQGAGPEKAGPTLSGAPLAVAQEAKVQRATPGYLAAEGRLDEVVAESMMPREVKRTFQKGPRNIYGFADGQLESTTPIQPPFDKPVTPKFQTFREGEEQVSGYFDPREGLGAPVGETKRGRAFAPKTPTPKAPPTEREAVNANSKIIQTFESIRSKGLNPLNMFAMTQIEGGSDIMAMLQSGDLSAAIEQLNKSITKNNEFIKNDALKGALIGQEGKPGEKKTEEPEYLKYK
jgi:hypothetical protein